jgi:hypothetical protein
MILVTFLLGCSFIGRYILEFFIGGFIPGNSFKRARNTGRGNVKEKAARGKELKMDS